ncbi:FHA domain-containing protein [Nannocystis pusilla]|uniref:FHA domain-containing protein n=1 Tax=Nannocystis pusilla TaxID=889268 RepID=UPI003B7A4C78
MAVLRAHSSEERLILPDRCLVGRSKSCDLVLGARDVSGRHAEIQWDGDHWELHDLGSRNGTCVDGARLAAESAWCCARGRRSASGVNRRSSTWRTRPGRS